VSLLDRGAFVITIDTEMAWGEAHKRDGSVAGHRFDREREVVDRLLDVFARYELPATWAVVGHLFLDRCERGADGRPHPDLARPDYAWLGDGADWLDIDPCTSEDADPFHYGADMVRAIVDCPVHQEVGSHSFSHVIVDDPGCTPEVFAAELAQARAVAEPYGVDLRSFVYPRNAIAHLDTLAAGGFTSYRGGRATPAFAGMGPLPRKAARLVDKVVPLAGSAVHPVRDPSGLWNLPQTYLFAPVTTRRQLPPALWARRPIGRLRQAARARSLFHLWFHPYNVTADPDRSIAALEHIARAAARLRDRGRLDTITMTDLATRLSGDATSASPAPAPTPAG
jgi:peptidoglycan/xylan/chitin deacetylase (PgdA/CDA1 family)